jgi:ABC-2 type transport system permease protein
LFAEPAAYYIPGYLAVVVLFTPLSRVGSEVARHREGARFEKLATTPLTRVEWLLAQTLVNVAIIGLAAVLIFGLVVGVTGANIALSGTTMLVVPFILLGVALFCGFGAVLGSVADSQDGVIAASNGVALPLLFLSETFVSPGLLPEWLPLWLSPLTYFSRGVREVTYAGAPADPFGLTASGNLVILGILAILFFTVGAYALPQTD